MSPVTARLGSFRPLTFDKHRYQFTHTEFLLMAQQLPLSQNRFALVDDADFPALSRSRWSYRAERRGSQGYAVRAVKIDGKYRKEYLHRVVAGTVPTGMEVIFLNHDRLDCRRENLRVITVSEARRHHRVRSDSGSGVKGVTYNHERDTWTAAYYRGGRRISVGTFRSREDAVAVHERAVKEWDAGAELPQRMSSP